MPFFSGKPRPWEPVIRSMQLPPPPKRPEVGGLTVFFGGQKKGDGGNVFGGAQSRVYFSSRAVGCNIMI